MPRKRHHVTSLKPFSVACRAQSSSSSSAADEAVPGVNQLLANLRHASVAPAARRPPAAPGPSLPPALREVLQLPEPPAPLPRRPRFDDHGRRLPPGPAPPRSWVSARPGQAAAGWSSRCSRLVPTALPGAYMPAAGSLVDMMLRRLAADWGLHRVYNQYHLYLVPSHLKPALMRYIGVASEHGVSMADLRAILLAPEGVYGDDELGGDSAVNTQVTSLDLSGSIGRSISLASLSRLLFPWTQVASSEEVQESWDAVDAEPSPPRMLLPNLTHLSLALDANGAGDGSWTQLLALAAKLTTVTHLSLAFWPAPCLTPRARDSAATLTWPQGRRMAYSGTDHYAHSLGQDWSEALLVLRMLSRTLYRLECLDLTGCASWFKALKLADGHDFVDWAWSWGSVRLLRLGAGWTPGEDALPSEQIAFREAVEMAESIERHIIAQRAGKGLLICVERDKMEN